MAKTQTVLQVFVASPSDVKDERTLLDGVISEFNKTWGVRNGVILELLKWETHSHPAFGNDAQDVINDQIGDDYDIFVGIMWGRFGSSTKRAESGTEEEFNRAYDRHIRSPNSVQIMLYFKDAGLPPSKIDSEQLRKIQNFKARISDECGGLYHSFETPEQFQTSVRMHLSTVVQDWLGANESIRSIDSIQNASRLDLESTDTNPLANLQALETEPVEVGLIELVESANESMTEVTHIVQRMTEATTILNNKFVLATEVADHVPHGDVRAAKRVSNKTADDLETFVERMSVEIVEFNKYSTFAMDTFGNIAMMSENDFNEDKDDFIEARINMQAYTAAITASAKSLVGFREVIFNLPRMTTAFNRARKRAVAVMDDLLNQLRIAASQSDDVVKLLDRLEPIDNDVH